MLKDLEKRDAFLEQNSDQALDGLYSAYDIELADKKRSYSFLFLVICMIAFCLSIAINFPVIKDKVKSYVLEFSEIKKNNETIAKLEIEPKKNNIVYTEEKIKETLENEVTDIGLESISEDKKDISKSFGSLKLDESIFLSDIKIQEKLNKIESIQFEIDDAGINLIMKMPEEIDYLVYSLTNPERTVIEVKNVELTFRLEDLEPVEPIVAIRYSINDENRFKLVLESDSPLIIRKSVTTKSNNTNDLMVMMDYQWETKNNVSEEKNDLIDIVDQQVEIQKDIVFKGDIVKTPVGNSSDVYAETLFKDAYISYKKGNTSESLKKLNVVLNHNPAHTKARSTLALALSEKDHYELAYSVLNEGLIQYPENMEWITVYARLLLNQGKIIEAGNLLEKQKPELAYNTEYYALQAAVLQKLEQNDKAARIYRDLLHVNPLKAIWWMGLGISLESLRRYDDALYAYQKATNNRTLANESRQFILQRITRLTNILADESS